MKHIYLVSEALALSATGSKMLTRLLTHVQRGLREERDPDPAFRPMCLLSFQHLFKTTTTRLTTLLLNLRSILFS